MQASNCSRIDNDSVSSLTESLASEDSNIPYTLDIEREDDISIQMLELYQELLPSKESHDKRMRFVELMERLLNTEWPNHDIKANVFGSSVNDLGTSSSDVDLCLTTNWNELLNIRILAKLFRKCGMQHVVCVPRAKVPIVRLFDPELQLACDINVNNTLALLNTKMIKTYVAIDPRVRPLIMIIKNWTKQRFLNDAANGGTLSSYTWTCMVINFLQQREPPILPVLHQMKNENKDDDYFFDDLDQLEGFGSGNHESLGGLLYAFFRRYAIEFNYDDQVISVRQGRYLTKAEKGWDIGRNKISLCVEEPCNVSRNLGNSADIGSVRGLIREFQRFLELLIEGETLDRICTPYQPILFNAEIPLLNLKLPNQKDSSSHHFDRRKSMGDRSTSATLAARNSRHSSHPLPPVPTRLLSMLNISPDQPVDKILARCYQDSVKNKRNNDKKRRKSNGAEWPNIITPPQHRSRRKQSTTDKKPTLAEIVKVHLPPSKTPTASPPPTSKKNSNRKPSRKKHA